MCSVMSGWGNMLCERPQLRIVKDSLPVYSEEIGDTWCIARCPDEHGTAQQRVCAGYTASQVTRGNWHKCAKLLALAPRASLLGSAPRCAGCVGGAAVVLTRQLWRLDPAARRRHEEFHTLSATLRCAVRWVRGVTPVWAGMLVKAFEHT